MKELLVQYASYNVWANARMIDAMLSLDPSAVDKEIISSFTSLRKTVYHMWGAEDIWMQRLQRVEDPAWVAGSFDGSFEEACRQWRQMSIRFLHYVSSTDESGLQVLLHFKDMKGNPHTRRIWEVLTHVSNHATYHRGQLVTMLRQVGATGIPGTDFSRYLNELGQAAIAGN